MPTSISTIMILLKMIIFQVADEIYGVTLVYPMRLKTTNYLFLFFFSLSFPLLLQSEFNIHPNVFNAVALGSPI